MQYIIRQARKDESYELAKMVNLAGQGPGTIGLDMSGWTAEAKPGQDPYEVGQKNIENEDDAKYWVACVHFLRTMTKMFYGNGDHIGNPPLISRLNGYGKYVLNDIPVLLKNFQIELGSDIDYVPVTLSGDPKPNYVPTRSTITVTCSPNYARSAVSRFNLKEFANGNFVNKPEGFV